MKQKLPKKITFITTQELENLYPEKSMKDREHAICEEKGAVFLIGIGNKLKSGKPHDLRAADYDDWNLNGDLLVWSDVLGKSIELSSMGVRVNKESLEKQMKLKNINESIKQKEYHSKILKGELGSCIGGGIGKSRLLMFLLERRHIAEVQVGVWKEGVLPEGKGFFFM